MGWFDDQIRERKQNDSEVLEEAFCKMADAVTGQKTFAGHAGEREKTRNALAEILKFYHIKTSAKAAEIPDDMQDFNERLEYVMRPYGIMRRTVKLEPGWYRDAVGAMLAVRKSDQSVVAMIPSGFSGYTFFDDATGKRVRVSRKNQELFEEEAIAFYKPFPLRKIRVVDLIRYMAGTLSGADLAVYLSVMLAITLVGLLGPELNRILMGPVIESGQMTVLWALVSFMICVTVSTLMMRAVESLLMARIQTKLSFQVDAATMARMLSLPADFFKPYSAGELSAIMNYVGSLCQLIVSMFLSTGISSVFSLVYLSQIFVYAPALAVPSIVITLVTLSFSMITTFVQMRISKRQMTLSAKENGLSYALITGVQKIKLAGAEKRSFAKWGRLYADMSELMYNPPALIKYSGTITLVISLTGQLVLYHLAVISQVGIADYYAFNTAYGLVSSAMSQTMSIAITFATIKPIFDMVKPILEAEPEVAEGKTMVTRLSGGIELNNVSFRYRENMPWIVDNLSLKIRPGQYVAIVGETGCGKTTLMRLLLGFEKPEKGAIYYDGRDLAQLDLKSLRRRIGVVTQNGKLFTGDIYSNIVISAPWLSMEDAWEAAERAGVAEDIRRMPMGMQTLISEGSGGISGGQRQRLMIARAIAPKPRILMFDEATSALDNLTQKKVSDALGQLRCTRIVIAHRLSTIRQCDRILYLEGGRIAEEGSYEELIALGGRFADLVARQRLDVPSDTDGK